MTLTKQAALEKEQRGEGSLAIEGRHIVFRRQDGSSYTQWGFRSPALALSALDKLRNPDFQANYGDGERMRPDGSTFKAGS